MQRLLALVILTSAGSAFAHDRDCPRGYRDRAPEEVLESHRALLALGDVEKDVRCNYAEDAVVVSDQGVVEGREQIALALQGLVNFFGGAIPAVHEQIIVRVLNDRTHMARVLFSVETPCIDVPDGADTYLIKRGQIHGQTAHGFPVFKCGPPPF